MASPNDGTVRFQRNKAALARIAELESENAVLRAELELANALLKEHVERLEAIECYAKDRPV